jgi:sulfoxide reductase catalytic subunit YedY
MNDAVEAFETKLTHADDRVRLSEWLTPQWGVVPRIRFGRRWFNVLWLIPIGVLLLIIGVPVALEVRQLRSVKAFMVRYPGYTILPIDYSGFRFQRPVPSGLTWAAKDDSVTLPGWLGISGIRHLIGFARWWHFSCDFLSVLNGAAFYDIRLRLHTRR